MKSTRFVIAGIGSVVLLPLSAAADGNPQQETIVHAVEQSAPIPVTYGTRVVDGEIDHAADSDRFHFVAEANDRVRIRIMTPDTLVDPQYQLLGPMGQVDGWSCDAGSNGCRFERELVLTDAGTYVIVIQDRQQNESGPYEFQLERIPPPAAERVIGYDRLICDTLDSRLDLDVFQFELFAGNQARIVVNTSAINGVDPSYELYAPSGLLADAWSCDSGASGCTFARDVTASETGTYSILVSDRLIDETGDYCVFVNCLSVSCPVAAGMAARNGSGVNPPVYSTPCPPVLGSTWHAEVDLTAFPGAVGVVLHFRPQAVTIPSLCGEILIAGPIAARVVLPIQGSSAQVDLLIPRRPSLAGYAVGSQAIILGPPCYLTNAVDLVVGY
jgi:hypothetical protein